MRVLSVLLVLSTACSIVNRPADPPDADPGDAGPEADVPLDVPDVDGGTELCSVFDDEDEDGDGEINCADVEDCEGMDCSADGSGSCVCRNGRPVEVECTNAFDDDNDGTADCSDFDCSGLNLQACCINAGVPDHWPTDACPKAGWTEHGGEVVCEGDALTEFFATEPFGMVWRDCISLALGASFELDFEPELGDADCDDDGRCDEHVALLVAERDEPREGNGRFFAELAIRVHASGLVEVLQGDTPVPGASRMLGLTLTRVRVDFIPTTSEEGRAELHASVYYGAGSPMLLWQGFVVELDDLIADGRCADVPGFYLALEGKGDGVTITGLAATQSECANPNLFQPSVDHVLTPYDYGEPFATSLELDPPRLLTSPRLDDVSWATQALSSPTLMRRGGSWHVAAEASNDQPANEPSFRVGYAIAFRESTTWSTELTGWVDDGRDTPWVGEYPPSCLDGSCVEGEGGFTPENPPFPSVRDPFLFETGGVELLAYAGEVDSSGAPARSERFGIYIASQDDLRARDTPDDPVLAPNDVSGCDSLRDPMVTSRPGGSGTDFWLFFTCYEGLSSQGIWAVPMRSVVGFSVLREGDAIVPPAVVLAPGDLDFGRGGTLRSPEIIIDELDGTSVFAMWFLVGQEVGLAVGAGKADFDEGRRNSTDDVPVMQLFAGNPVLTPADRAFSRTCSGCSIEGLAVTYVDESTRRFLIARENDDTPARYDLLPLDQTWRNLARP